MSKPAKIDWPAAWALGVISAITGTFFGLLPTALYPSSSLLQSIAVLFSHSISGFILAFSLTIFRARLRMGLEVYAAMLAIGLILGLIISVLLGTRGSFILGDILFGGFLGCVVGVSAKLYDHQNPDSQDEASMSVFVPGGVSYGTCWRAVGQLNGWWP